MADIQNEAIVVGSQAKALDQHISICYHVHMVPREKKYSRYILSGRTTSMKD